MLLHVSSSLLLTADCNSEKSRCKEKHVIRLSDFCSLQQLDVSLCPCWFRSYRQRWWAQGGQRSSNAMQEPWGDHPHSGTLFLFHPTYVSACSFDPHLCFLFISLRDSLHNSSLRFVSFYCNRISLSHLPGTVRRSCNLQSDPRHQRRAGSRWHRGNMHPAIGIPAFGRHGFLWFNLQHRIIGTKWTGDWC